MATTIHETRSRTLRAEPRFGGVLWRLARWTSPLMLGLAGRRWNPIFSVVEHTGRRTGRSYAAPVAARRAEGGFVIALAFGAQVDWYRNLVAAGGGTIRWRDVRHAIGAPVRIDAATAITAFNPVQRAFVRLAGLDGYVHVPDAAVAVATE